MRYTTRLHIPHRQHAHPMSCLVRMVCIAVVGVIGLGYPVSALEQRDYVGVAGGESTQQSGQQGLGVTEASSSNVILGGPEIIIGSIQKIHNDNYTINGDRGQQIQIRVTADTNKVCAHSGQGKVSSGQEGVTERAEIPPTPFLEHRKSSGERVGTGKTQHPDDQQDLQRHATSPPSTDPSELKSRIGSTDPRANEDVARGSGFVVGACTFKEGDHVRVEASDMGTATTIKLLADSHGRSNKE